MAGRKMKFKIKQNVNKDHYPITRRQILDSFKPKEFADNNFKFVQKGSKFSNTVQNTVENEEIAQYEQFLLFPQCFQNFELQTHKN